MCVYMDIYIYIYMYTYTLSSRPCGFELSHAHIS